MNDITINKLKARCQPGRHVKRITKKELREILAAYNELDRKYESLQEQKIQQQKAFDETLKLIENLKINKNYMADQFDISTCYSHVKQIIYTNRHVKYILELDVPL